MSISKMDWSRRNSSGAVAHPNNQQYLPQSTSSTVPAMASHMTFVPPTSYNPAQTIVTNSCNSLLLKGLLGAKSTEEILKIQQSALLKIPVQQTMQVSPGQYNSSYSLLHKTTTANQLSNRNIQNPVVSNYQTQFHPNSVILTVQQAHPVSVVQQQAHPVSVVQQQAHPLPMIQQQAQPVPMVQQQAQPVPMVQQQAQPVPVVQQQAQPVPVVQQQAQPVPMVQQQAQPVPMVQQQAQPVPMVQQQAQPVQCYGANGQNTREFQQSLPSTQSGGYSHKRSYQQMPNSYAAKKHCRNLQEGYQTIVPQQKSVIINSVSTGSSAQYAMSCKALNDKNMPVLSSNYHYGQNIQNQIGSDYQTISCANTLQPKQDMNGQSPQKQTIPNLLCGFANNPSNVLPSVTVGQMPPLYPQSNQNVSNVNNVTVSQRLSNANQNFVAQDVQQPVQSYTVPQDQHSMGAPPPPYGANVPQDQRHNVPEILALLKVYQNVKQKYLLLNRENNLLRQKMHSSSQNNFGSFTVRPPLISSLPNRTFPTNDLGGEQEVSQNSNVQSRPLSNTMHSVQTPSLYNASLNVPVQDIAQPSNSFSSHVYPTNNSHVVGNQRNYTGQAIASETLRVPDPQETSMVSIQKTNQYLSCANSSNGNLSQGGLHINSVQNHSHTTASPESCNLNTANVDNFYANKPLSSSSREAIKASLPLWKSFPQSSAPIKSGSSESKQHIVNSIDSVHSLEEISCSSINEHPVTLTQKSEHSGSNVSKGIKLQVARVPPLVQIKELVNEINQCPKVVSQVEVLACNGVNRFKENDCFNNFPLPFDSVNATAAMNNLDDVPATSNLVSSSPCNVDQNSTENMETVDNLQISGICTLVEGNSFYDSSIAMMFEGPLQTQPDSPLAKNDHKDDLTLQCSQEVLNLCGSSQATSSVSPTTETEAIKSAPQGEMESSVIRANQQVANDYCLESQSEQNLSTSDVFDLESNDASDQLSELLTEFPFGIKNYMSENKHDRNGISLLKLKENLEIPQSIPFSCGRKGDESIEDTQTVCAIDTLTKETVCEKTAVEQQSIEKSMPTAELPREETSVQPEDDGFEVSDSPDANIHITLIDQDEIPKIFPEDSVKQQGEESLGENIVRESEVLVVDVAVSSIKEKSEKKATSIPDKELFCCLFSWLTHTNRNAPKCYCKLTELGETEFGEDLANNFSQHSAVIKNDPLKDGLATSTDGLNASSPGHFKMQPNEITNDEILPPVIKFPKLEPIKISLEGKQGPYIINCSSQENIQSKLDLCKNPDQSRKELIKNDTLMSESILQSKGYLEDPSSKRGKDLFLGCKSKVDGSQKLEKLIVKTDFLKNNHLLKMKQKYKEIKTVRVEGGARNVHKINKNTEVSESVKALNMDRVIGDETNNEKCKLPVSIVQQSKRSMNKLKSSSNSVKSHSRNKDPSLRKHKERVKNRPESHFEKVKKVPTVQEYLERKRELCNKRSEPKVVQRDESAVVRHRVVERASMERNENGLLAEILTSPPAQINVKTKNIELEANYQAKKGQPKTNGVYKPLHKKHRDSPASSHGKRSLINRGLDQKTTSSREKIYLSPLDGSRLTSYEGISLTKLQIRHSPEKTGYLKRRKSLDSSVHSNPSKSDQSQTKNRETPKMLEFKLCPEFGNKSLSTQEKKGELKTAKEKSIVEGIKSKKEAWCSGGPFKKTLMDSSSDDQGLHSPSLLSSAFMSAQKNLRPVQDSQTTFNVFRQMYHEKRSKSLDSNL